MESRSPWFRCRKFDSTAAASSSALSSRGDAPLRCAVRFSFLMFWRCSGVYAIEAPWYGRAMDVLWWLLAVPLVVGAVAMTWTVLGIPVALALELRDRWRRRR
jgi:hypothetical protein